MGHDPLWELHNDRKRRNFTGLRGQTMLNRFLSHTVGAILVVFHLALAGPGCTKRSSSTALAPQEGKMRDIRARNRSISRAQMRGERAYMTSTEDLFGKMYLRAEQKLLTYPGVVSVQRAWPSFAGFVVYTSRPGEVPEVLYGYRVRALPRRVLE